MRLQVSTTSHLIGDRDGDLQTEIIITDLTSILTKAHGPLHSPPAGVMVTCPPKSRSLARLYEAVADSRAWTITPGMITEHLLQRILNEGNVSVQVLIKGLGYMDYKLYGIPRELYSSAFRKGRTEIYFQQPFPNSMDSYRQLMFPV